MNEQTLGFQIGTGFSKILLDIAREKIYCDYKLYDAIRVITNSLCGCSEEQAIDIIKGKIQLIEDGNNVITIPFNPKIHRYEDFDGWIEEKLYYYKDMVPEWKDVIKNIRRETISCKGIIRINVEYHKLFEYITNDNIEDIFERDDNNLYCDLKTFTITINAFFTEYFNFLKCINDLYKTYPDNISSNYCNVLPEIRKLHNEYIELVKRSDKIIFKGICSNTELHKYIGSIDEQKLKYANDSKLNPDNILDNFDAGWLSPEGDFYGLNGTMGNFLHLQISDQIIKTKTISIPVEYYSNPDTWLSKNGWIRIHGKGIDYDGYFDIDNIIPITEKQKEQLYQYGKHCHNGYLVFGTNKKIHMNEFNSMELPMLKRLFS